MHGGSGRVLWVRDSLLHVGPQQLCWWQCSSYPILRLGTREGSAVTVRVQGLPRSVPGVAGCVPTAPQSLLQRTGSTARGVSSLARREFGIFLCVVSRSSVFSQLNSITVPETWGGEGRLC